jgi:APA family basic amino acid/polyamine antiporter
MENALQKKYGLLTAIAMVVGIVIGSGVFFKAEKVLTATGGNLPLGILAWVIGGLIMIVCAYVFATMATRYASAACPPERACTMP